MLKEFDSSGLFKETREIGMESLKELNRQNNKLSKSNTLLDGIHNDLNTAETSLKAMDGFWDRIVAFFSTASYSQQTHKEFKHFHPEKRNLDDMLDEVSDLKDIAKAMSLLLDEGNDLIDKMVTSTDSAQYRTEIAIKTVRRLKK